MICPLRRSEVDMDIPLLKGMSVHFGLSIRTLSNG